MSTNDVSDGSRGRLSDAFERVGAELRALPEKELLKINLDVPTAVGTILGALPKIVPFRAEIARELPGYDLGRFDRLADYALALAYAHGAYLAAAREPRSMEELGAEAAVLRDILLADAAVQAARGNVDRELIAQLRSGIGYRDTAVDLIALVNLYRTRWSVIEGRTGVSTGELEMAEILADRLMTSIGLREQAPEARSAAIDDRMRAFTLCIKAYNHARRALTYLRYEEGDLESFAPSLYAGRGRRSLLAAEHPEPQELAEPAKPAEPQELSGGAGGNQSGGRDWLHPVDGSAAPSAQVGMPGSNPFTE